MALDDGGVWGNDEGVFELRGVEELAVTPEAGGFRATGAAVPLIEPDDDANDPGDPDNAPRDRPREDRCECALAVRAWAGCSGE